MNNIEDLNKLAANVLEKYSVSPEYVSVYKNDKSKTVWKIKSKEGMLYLKHIKQRYDRALFLTYAQNHIKEVGGNVPEIIKNNSNQLLTKYNEQSFVLCEWIHGKELSLNNNSTLLYALKGLALFHISSRGYDYPKNVKISSKLGKMPKQYNVIKKKLLKWKELSKGVSLPYYATYLKYVDSILEITDLALTLLSKSDYDNLVAPSSKSPVLCHENFGKGNVIQTKNEAYVIDLDGISFDLPVRDLSKIIRKQAENINQWSMDNIKYIIDCYSDINPLNINEKEILYIDLLYPHNFFDFMKNLFQYYKPVSPSEIERIAKLEQSKINLLKYILKK